MQRFLSQQISFSSSEMTITAASPSPLVCDEDAWLELLAGDGALDLGTYLFGHGFTDDDPSPAAKRQSSSVISSSRLTLVPTQFQRTSASWRSRVRSSFSPTARPLVGVATRLFRFSGMLSVCMPRVFQRVNCEASMWSVTKAQIREERVGTARDAPPSRRPTTPSADNGEHDVRRHSTPPCQALWQT